jgi:hypothetical protein
MSEQKASDAADKARGAARRSSGLEDDVAIVKTTPSATKRKEDMRNESTGITVGDSAHTLADVRGVLGSVISRNGERTPFPGRVLSPTMDAWVGTDCWCVGMTQGKTIHYSAERIIGNGSFGVVFQVGCLLEVTKHRGDWLTD